MSEASSAPLLAKPPKKESKRTAHIRDWPASQTGFGIQLHANLASGPQRNGFLLLANKIINHRYATINIYVYIYHMVYLKSPLPNDQPSPRSPCSSSALNKTVLVKGRVWPVVKRHNIHPISSICGIHLRR